MGLCTCVRACARVCACACVHCVCACARVRGGGGVALSGGPAHLYPGGGAVVLLVGVLRSEVEGHRGMSQPRGEAQANAGRVASGSVLPELMVR